MEFRKGPDPSVAIMRCPVCGRCFSAPVDSDEDETCLCGWVWKRKIEKEEKDEF